MDSKVSNVHIHGAKDSIQNEVNTEEASPSHVDSTAPPNAASPSALQTITQVGDKSLRIQGVEPSTQVNVVVGSAKDSSITSSNSPVMPLHSSAMAVSSTNWPTNTSTGSKTTNLSNSNHLSPQKENISDSKGNNLSTNTQTPTTSGSHDMLTPAMKVTSPANYTPETVNFSSPSTPIDSSSSGSFNQFPVNPEKTTPGQPTSPNNAAKAKPFVCSVCNQTFSRQHNLKSHALTHSQEKPFQCPTCLHFFRRHHDLKRHAKLHTGEKPYQCQHCKRSFARLDALNRHLRAESFCGGPQKKLYQGTESKLEQSQQPPPIQLPPQQTTPQPQMLMSTQSQPQSKSQLQVQGDVTTKSQNQQSDLKTNIATTPQQQIVQPQQFKEAQNKQTTNPSTSPQAKTDISRQTQDFYKRPPMIHQEPYSWPIQTQQPTPIQTIPSPNTQPLQAKPVISIANPATTHQIVFPLETPIPTNSSTSHYSMQYTQSEFNVQESQRRTVPEALMANEQDMDSRILHNKASQKEMALIIERNNYLEERVRELENEVINERKLRSRREFLETRVNELEIEKKLLKQLLLERDTNGNSDINQNHEKKRKATSPIEPSNSKHQKDGE
ncbi:12292_t:CDS:2, partial [Acaulospora morrowiae]